MLMIMTVDILKYFFEFLNELSYVLCSLFLKVASGADEYILYSIYVSYGELCQDVKDQLFMLLRYLGIYRRGWRPARDVC